MGLAANCLRFVEALGVNEEGAEESFALLQDLCRVLEEQDRLPALLPLFFRLRLAGALGFAPNLAYCGACGAPLTDRALFAVDEGQMRCAACRAKAALPATRYGVELSPAGLDLLRRVQQEFPSAWPVEDGPSPDRRACARAIDGFVQYHLGLAWEGGYFRRV